MAATSPNRGPRSAAGAIASLIFLVGVPLSILSAILIGGGASAVIHAVLGATFFTLAFAVADFDLPPRLIAVASAAMLAFAAIVSLQGVADVTHSPAMDWLAYGILGQWLERLFGYVFLGWCIGVLVLDSTGTTRLVGGIAIATALGVDLFSLGARLSGSSAAEWLKLAFLLLFVWILSESLKRTPIAPRHTNLAGPAHA
jgi:hypothetical protein